MNQIDKEILTLIDNKLDSSIETIKDIIKYIRREEIKDMTLEEKVDFVIEELYIKRGLE